MLWRTREIVGFCASNTKIYTAISNEVVFPKASTVNSLWARKEWWIIVYLSPDTQGIIFVVSTFIS